MSPSHPGSAYVSDILGQPDCLRRLDMNRIAAVAGPLCRPSAAGRRTILTGMGSSFAAMRPLWTALVENGVPAWRVDAAECLGHFGKLIDETTLVLAASQSGRSAELVALAEAVKHRGAKLLAITNDLDSPLARWSDAAVDIRVGLEETVSTKTYVNTLGVALALERLMLGRPFDDALLTTADAMAAYLTTWRERTDRLKDRVTLPGRLFLLARGPSLAAAEYGALIVKEAARWPAEAQSVPQFRHGPLELADDRLVAIVLAGADPVARGLNRALHDDLERYGARSFWLDDTGAQDVFAIPSVAAGARAILEALPLQLLSIALAEQSGIRPGEFRHLQKVTTVL